MTSHQHPPTRVTSLSRAQIDADALHAAVARQRAKDQAQPPSRHLSKMAAIRIVADLIAVRRENGWTDAQIVALLSDQLGVNLTVGTLRVYVHRLRQEGSFPLKTREALVAGMAPAGTQIPVEDRASADSKPPQVPAPGAGELQPPVEQAPRTETAAAEMDVPEIAGPAVAAKPTSRFNPRTTLNEDL